MNTSQYSGQTAKDQRKAIEVKCEEFFKDFVEHAEERLEIVSLLEPVLVTPTRAIIGNENMRIYIPIDMIYRLDVNEPDETWCGVYGEIRITNSSFPEIHAISSVTSKNMNLCMPNTSPETRQMKIVSLMLIPTIKDPFEILRKINNLKVGFKEYDGNRYSLFSQFVILTCDNEWKEFFKDQDVKLVSVIDLDESVKKV